MLGRRKGFTLIETLAAIMLTAMLLGALASFSFAFMQTSREGDVMHALQRDLVFGLEAIESEVRIAKSMTSGAGTWMLEQVTYDKDAKEYGARTVTITHDSLTNTLRIGERVLSRNVASFSMTPVSGRPERLRVEITTIAAIAMVRSSNLPLSLGEEVVMWNYNFTPPEPGGGSGGSGGGGGGGGNEPLPLDLVVGDPPWDGSQYPIRYSSPPRYSVEIQWITSIPCTTLLTWGETGKTPAEVRLNTSETNHAYLLSDLKYSTSYTITISVTDSQWGQGASQTRTFSIPR